MYPKLPYLKAQDITQRYEPSPEVQELLTEDLSPKQLISALEQEKNFPDLITFLAHGLPPREGVGWALDCNQEIISECNQEEKLALNAAKAWFINPCERNRRNAEKAAAKAELQTAPGWVAQAVFWTGGSMTATDTPIVPPPLWLYCHAIAGAVNLAAVLPDGLNAQKRYSLFLEKALNIAEGKN